MKGKYSLKKGTLSSVRKGIGYSEKELAVLLNIGEEEYKESEKQTRPASPQIYDRLDKFLKFFGDCYMSDASTKYQEGVLYKLHTYLLQYIHARIDYAVFKDMEKSSSGLQYTVGYAQSLKFQQAEYNKAKENIQSVLYDFLSYLENDFTSPIEENSKPIAPACVDDFAKLTDEDGEYLVLVEDYEEDDLDSSDVNPKRFV